MLCCIVRLGSRFFALLIVVSRACRCPQLAADSPAVHSFFSLVLPLLKQLNGAVVFLESLCARSEFAGLDSIRNYAAELLDNCVSTVTEVGLFLSSVLVKSSTFLLASWASNGGIFPPNTLLLFQLLRRMSIGSHPTYSFICSIPPNFSAAVHQSVHGTN